jgi:hypothetical protein
MNTFAKVIQRVMTTTFPSFRNPVHDDVFVPTEHCLVLTSHQLELVHEAVATADQLIADYTGVRTTIRFPKQVPLVADFVPTGILVVFELYLK